MSQASTAPRPSLARGAFGAVASNRGNQEAFEGRIQGHRANQRAR